MTDKEICTVDSFKRIVVALSELGYGNMPIFLGNNTPLLKDSICINYIENQLLIRNMYYDKQLIDAAEKLKDRIGKDIECYLADCYRAGLEIKEDEMNE